MSFMAVETAKADQLGVVNAPPSSRGATLAAPTVGEAWLNVARLILAGGAPSSFDGLPLLEVERVTLDISEPDPDDALGEALDAARSGAFQSLRVSSRAL
jgi:hypothetical protein